MSVQLLRNKLEQQKGQKIQLDHSVSLVQSDLSELKRSLRRHEQAREVIRTVGIETQRQLSFHISDITSLALDAVFDDPYELKVEFVERRNKTECDLKFVRDGHELDSPKDEAGVGAIDVAAFALRVASWTMQRPRSRSVIILDEPFKHLKGIKENHRVLEMIKEISSKLNLQIIMVSDERIPREDIIESADRTFEVTKHGNKSKIQIVQ